MTDFKYYELIASFYSYIFGLIKQGSEFDMAVNRTLDDYWSYPEYENRLSNLIILIHFSHVKYAMHKTFIAKQIEVYKNQLELIKNDDLTKWLSDEELEHFNESIYNLNGEIENYLRSS